MYAKIPETGFTRLTSGYPAGYPDWSPDGQYIVFTGMWSDSAEGNLLLIPVEGGEPVQITERGAHHGVFSPYGSYIALDALAGTVVQLIPAGGGVPVRIVPEEIHIERSANPAWAPDGRRIVFRSDSLLYVLHLPSGKFNVAWDSGNLIPMPIQWVPGTEDVIVALINPEDHTAAMWRIPLDGSEPLQLTSDGSTTQGTVSPDGNVLVYSLTTDGESFDLWAVLTAGGTPVQLTDDGYDYVEPCFSPDGTQLVVRTNRDGSYDLWLMELDLDAVKADLAAIN